MWWLVGGLACASPEATPIANLDGQRTPLRQVVAFVGRATGTRYALPVDADEAFLGQRVNVHASQPLTADELTTVLDVALAQAGYATEPHEGWVLIVDGPTAAPLPQLPGGVGLELLDPPRVPHEPSPAPAYLGVVKLEPGAYELDGAEVAAWLDDERWGDVARIAPARDDQGALRGQRLSGIRRLSILASLGLRNGTIVHDVDGRLLETPEQREEARRHVRRQAEARGQVVLSTVWRNEPQTLTYRFR